MFLNRLIVDAFESMEDGVLGFSVIVTCRTDDDLDSILGSSSGFPLAVRPISISVSEFDDDEIQSLIRTLSGGSNVGQRIKSHLQLRQGRLGDQAPSVCEPVVSDRLDIVRHPVLWRCFAQLPEADQNLFLDGQHEALGTLAAAYIDWFYRKVDARIGHLALNAAKIAMIFSAKRFIADTSRDANLTEDWLAPCVEAGCPPIHRMPIFNEAISAGLIERQGNAKWRWLRPWLCEWIALQEAADG